MLRLFAISFLCFCLFNCGAQELEPVPSPKFDYQIYLKKPALEIRELLEYKECSPIKGNLSPERQKIIMQDYEPGKRVYVRIRYEDGSEEEFIRNPCFIDPVIL